MDLSIFLAKVLGLYFIIGALICLLKYKSMRKIIDGFTDNTALLYVTGVITVILGLMMVISHNIWEGGWRVVITLIGWLILLKGLAFLLLPEKIMFKFAKSFRWSKEWYFVVAIIMVLFGVYLASKGFGCCF
ncbi:hypothetical protein KKG58_02520 [Patescibacteria group bacterium]|nr:hypothetical protein [Patescibacteria group bacterium]